MNQSIGSVGAQRHRSRRKRHFRLLRRIVVLLMLFLFLVLLVDLIEYQPQAVLQPGPAHAVALSAHSPIRIVPAAIETSASDGLASLASH